MSTRRQSLTKKDVLLLLNPNTGEGKPSVIVDHSQHFATGSEEQTLIEDAIEDDVIENVEKELRKVNHIHNIINDFIRRTRLRLS